MSLTIAVRENIRFRAQARNETDERATEVNRKPQNFSCLQKS